MGLQVIEYVRIENFKSIEDLVLDLGRVNVFVGENGAGKSNILEAIGLAAAAEAGKLDNEFLASRGIRVSSAKLMRAAFDAKRSSDPILITTRCKEGRDVQYELKNDNKPYSSWETSASFEESPKEINEIVPLIEGMLSKIKDKEERKLVGQNIIQQMKDQILAATNINPSNDKDHTINLQIQLSIDSAQNFHNHEGMSDFDDFLIYSPENSALRTFEKEGQVEPLGVNGEGLLRFLEVLSLSDDKAAINEIKNSLNLFEWFNGFDIKKRRSDSRMSIIDTFVDHRSDRFDQRSANEGFLFVAFYFSLLASKITPAFFAIDNVDTALNPKLCEEVVSRITKLAKSNNKQVILTTHNPAVLDGLDLTDEDQRLFIVSRDSSGKTRIRRFRSKPTGKTPTRLSELFLRGALGGLPKGF